LVRALGIDPGTKSFDLVVIDGPKVIYELSIETIKVARNPKVLIDAIESVGDVDIIVGPSGYGTPVVCNEDIIDAERFAIEILLLSSKEDISEGVKRGELGMAVYDALAKIVKYLWRSKYRVCYIPSVILLPTVPLHRKINRIDMGTADKLAVTALAIYDESRRLGIRYDETKFILVELGFGYNAVIAVDGGKVVDGYGGTLTRMGFMTIGAIDAEVVVAGRFWRRSDVFYGGVSTLCNEHNLEKALERASIDELCSAGFTSMMESIEHHVRGMLASVKDPHEIIVSGRLSRIPKIYDDLRRRLSDAAPIVRIRGLDGARLSKEAAQGYAILGEGIAGGYFKDLVEIMEIMIAKGTTLSWVYHPRVMEVRRKLEQTCMKVIKRKEVCKLSN